jgi:hypothetical protein
MAKHPLPRIDEVIRPVVPAVIISTTNIFRFEGMPLGGGGGGGAAALEFVRKVSMPVGS